MVIYVDLMPVLKTAETIGGKKEAELLFKIGTPAVQYCTLRDRKDTSGKTNNQTLNV